MEAGPEEEDKMLMSHEAITHILIITGKTMTVIKFLVFIRACGAIKHRFSRILFITFPGAVFSFHPAMVRPIIIHGMERVSIITS